jgi:hypothetical protein
MSSNKKTTAQKQPSPAAAQKKPANRPPGGGGGSSNQRTGTTNADPEGQAILTCLEALRGLAQPNARQRVMNYVATRYNLRITGWQGQTESQTGTETEPGVETVGDTEGARTLSAAG